MKTLTRIATGLAALALTVTLPVRLHAETLLTFQASDGVAVHASAYPAAGTAKAAILLFHQAGSNRGEYNDIAPRLAALGYDVIAVDQRSGGDRFGRSNATVRALGTSTNYLDALSDLEAALAYVKKTSPEKPAIVWGSSYSAALVFLLAARHQGDVAAVLAFSPGEYLGSTSVRNEARNVTVPVFVTSASDDGEISAARDILAASASTLRTQFVPEAGVHGSSTLRADSNPEGANAAWKAVLAFLGKLSTPK